ncbi:MAG TPA: hypothetical protein ENJ82_16530 [Bacteroidetes bacterium]|nr:hypothetical protein [Bacteroidota bacterium]
MIEYVYELRFSVCFANEAQQDLIHLSNQNKIIDSAYQGWILWTRNDKKHLAWLLQLFQHGNLIKTAAYRSHLIFDLYTLN